MKRMMILFLAAATMLAACSSSKSAEKTDEMKKSESDEYVESMSKEHADDTAEASPAAEEEPATEVEGKEVTYATVGGNEVAGYLAKPAGAEGELPAVIVIHEWWGLNDNIRSMADQLAGEGYMALAVDLYGGEAAEKPEQARALMQKVMSDPGPASENLNQAYAYFAENGATKIGVIGWCFGGGWSLRTAMMMPDKIDATVIYYGHLVTEKKKLEKLDMPIIGFFGAEDEGIPVKKVKEFRSALEDLEKDAEINIYDGAGHAFANPSGERYQEDAAKDAWKKTKAFLAEHLKE